MKDAAKVYPVRTISIGGETFDIKLDWGTIYHFERENGKALLTVLQDRNELMKISVIVDLIYAGIKSQGGRQTKEWVLENMSEKVLEQIDPMSFVDLAKAAYGDEEKKSQAATQAK